MTTHTFDAPQLDAPRGDLDQKPGARHTRSALLRRYQGQATRREVRRDVLTVGAWSLIATSIALFLADNGIGYFATLGGAITALGIIAGLVATAFMCLMLVLTARVPVIDATLGQDRATSLHAKLGRGMVFGLLAHGILLAYGYALSDKISPIAAFTQLWTSSTDFIWACVAFLMLGVVGISSMVALRRKYPYEVWFGIHLTTYAAILASIPHQFSMSGMLAEGTWGRPFWAAMWLVTGGLMLAYRVILPILASLTHQFTVSRVTPVGPDAVSIEVTGRKVKELQARGGHWLNWRFLTPELAGQPHPFSLSAEPTDSTLRITVRNLGEGTARLMSLKPGTKVAIEGPYGMFTDASRTTDKVVLLGAGIGIAPIRALLESTEFAPGDAAVILRASTPDELYLLDEVVALCEAKGASLALLVGPRAGQSWVPVTDAGATLIDFVPWAAEADVYVCGPNPWMEAVLADVAACGIPAAQVHDEKFDW
jgi:predicted ferric reductase